MDQLWHWPTVTTVFFVSAVIVVILVRRHRFTAFLPQAAAFIPPSNSVVWRLSAPSHEPTEAAHKQRHVGVAEVAIIAAAPLSTTPGLLNSEVTTAPEHWQAEGAAFSGTPLADYLHAHHEEIFSASSTPDFVAALERFVGERVMLPQPESFIPGHADAGMSLKNGALDAAGVVGGGFIGMSFGQLLGRALLEPSGTTAVAALLSIGGAFLGRMLSDCVKRESFRAAVETLDAAKTSALERIENQRKIEQAAIKRFVEDRDEALCDAIADERRKMLVAARDGRNSADNERHLACRAFVSHLDETRQRIWKGFYNFRKTHQSSILTRWFYPREGDVAVELARRWARDASARVEQLHTFLWTLLSSPGEDKRTEANRVISEFIRMFDCNADRYYLRIKVHADRVATLQQEIEEQATIFDGRLKGLLVEAQREVNAFIDAAHVRLHERLGEIVKPVFGALERVRSEGRKLGKTIP